MTTKTRHPALQQLIEDSAQRTYDQWRQFECELRQADQPARMRDSEAVFWIVLILAFVSFAYLAGLWW